MAIGWLAVLQMVPWSDVIKNAPKVADAAKKLWSTVGKKPPEDGAADGASPDTPALSDSDAIATLQTRVATLEAATAELHEQMLASSAVIKALAEQNTQLIARVEASRMRLLWLAGATTLAAVMAALALALAR